jgi:hypothetical protein
MFCVRFGGLSENKVPHTGQTTRSAAEQYVHCKSHIRQMYDIIERSWILIVESAPSIVTSDIRGEGEKLTFRGFESN